ncbi:CUE domain containing protein [Entamoeba histolytica HM-1:IMSS-B]|uniref:CUE domain-containing protein n=6 Tax=Entamoeba histolytica TaxID=5759 RepID=C4LX59_ENTH1|nr:hypothetical protein EHI_159830 [Entamoeba histolytica HM-1:IMSS]EMD46368.1 CUE domain containing protein [Entamoeba histolytica KU27]EMH77362.1 CUE domain containing protein [Entamoeba histolytica HM-1:IMSS-B]EMS10887.1 CUE domain containing protein [Entamoeba histolytica HM-3:IMSS]ENY65484.1 CUE domain containing protein [Entamoeba histolytica HM-1:IMSS-A]GAT93318.1 hypothetical protein CL6EHI_159830 [Entamoeba histolytica]|eukprot:XP_651620.2 hypothetical protein EHI_159830 [Entamoeba histolytica HM-1:IMSS]
MQTITWKQGLEELKGMFPNIDSKLIEQTLRDNGGHMEQTVGVLLSFTDDTIPTQNQNHEEFISTSNDDISDEELARRIQEHEFNMYKSLGGRKAMDQFLKDLENPNHSTPKHNQEVKSFWNQLSASAQNVFKEMFKTKGQYQELPENEPTKEESKKDR